MKKLAFFALCGAFLILSACTVKPSTSNETKAPMETYTIEGTTWRLVELYGKTVPKTVNGKMPFLKIDSTTDRFSAWAGCNGIGGEWVEKQNGRIEFAKGLSTMMACENMEIETELNKALVAADNYTISGDTLSLNKARMAPLARFKAVKVDSLAQSLQGTWEVDYLSDAEVPFAELFPTKRPAMNFNVAEGSVHGSGSCNTFRSRVELEGNSIAFGPVMSTKMSCPGSGEAAFFKTLEKVNTYSVSGDTLTFIMGDIALMRLKRKG